MGLLREQGTLQDKELVSLLALSYLALFDYAQHTSPCTALVNHRPVHQVCMPFYHLL